MIAIIGTSDRPCWLAEACKILLLLLAAHTAAAACVCGMQSDYRQDTYLGLTRSHFSLQAVVKGSGARALCSHLEPTCLQLAAWVA